jgi:hypothetical protein
MAKLPSYLVKFNRWRIRTYIRIYRKFRPKRLVYHDPPRWGDGQYCEVRRTASTSLGQKAVVVAARVESIGPNTVWVRFADGGVGKFKKHQVTIK